MPHLNFVVAFKTITLLLGALVTYFAYKAYSRTDARPLGALALGFGIVTIGALSAGVVDQVLGSAQRNALLIESSLTMVGFAVVLYSLYAE
jgi:uncharacterized membrane protein